jgi:DNA-directed RNA polymerase subunit RPC12/RpoP
MEWYKIIRFACPNCGQELAVHGAQVGRGAGVTCQDCNQDMLLVKKGKKAEQGAIATPDQIVIELG